MLIVFRSAARAVLAHEATSRIPQSATLAFGYVGFMVIPFHWFVFLLYTLLLSGGDTRSPGFRMWLIIVVPAFSRHLEGLDQMILRRVFDVTVAKNNVGPAFVNSAEV